MKVEIQTEWYSVEQCRMNPKKLYVFGDNMIRIGKAGQAQIRDELNAFGIATKRLPDMTDISFFSDKQNEFVSILDDLHKLIEHYYSGEFETIVIPADGLGTGLSKMPEKSPELFNWMNITISKLLNIDYNPSVN